MADKIRKLRYRANIKEYRANSRDRMITRIISRISNIVILYIEISIYRNIVLNLKIDYYI